MLNTCLVADFTWSFGSDGCTIDFTDQTIGFPTSYTWDFGDGAYSFSSDLNQSHTYDESGTYTVTLTVTDDDNQTSSYSALVNVVGCSSSGGGGGIEPECAITGPSIAQPGQEITLYATPYGAGPFYYSWTTSSELEPSGNMSGSTAQFYIPESVSNNTTLTAYVTITDALGNEIDCNHNIQAVGQTPANILVVFGDRIPESYMELVLFPDVFNLPWYYETQFSIEPLNPGNTYLPFYSDWLIFFNQMDICDVNALYGGFEPQAPEYCLPPGEYKFCATIRTLDNNYYTTCKNITIEGEIPPPPPPNPPIELINVATGDNTKIVMNPPDDNSLGCTAQISYVFNEDPFPFNFYDPSCDHTDFVINWHLELLGSNLPPLTLTYATDADCFNQTTLLDLCYDWFNFNFGCNYGTIKVTADFCLASDFDYYNNAFSDCCVYINLDYSNDYQPACYTPDVPIYIDYMFASPEIQDIYVDGVGCGCHLM